MEVIQILNRIEEILKNKDLENSFREEKEDESISSSNSIKEIIYLILSFILKIFKLPFKLIGEYIKEEIATSIKKDARIVAMIVGISGAIFLFLSVLWLFLAIAVGAYFQEQGETLFVSVIYSIGFQVLSIILAATLAIFASKRIKSLQLLKNISQKLK